MDTEEWVVIYRIGGLHRWAGCSIQGWGVMYRQVWQSQASHGRGYKAVTVPRWDVVYRDGV